MLLFFFLILNSQIFNFFVMTVLVAEVTQPSLGVGYEIGRAVAMDKNILCLYRPQPEKRTSSL